MPQQPHWRRPEVRRIHNEVDREDIRELLQAHKLTHLDVLSRGDHLVIYLKDEDEKVPRVRFSRIGNDEYQLGVARHTGSWDMTPFTGTISELFTMVREQFSWLLTEI